MVADKNPISAETLDARNNNNNNDDNNNDINKNNNNQISSGKMSDNQKNNDDDIDNDSNDNDDNSNNKSNKNNKINNHTSTDGISEIQGLKDRYDENISVLQSELTVAKERLKYLSINPTTYFPMPPLPDVRTVEIELLKLQYQKETENQKQIDREKWQTQIEERYERDRRIEKERRDYEDEKDNLRRRLKEEELKVSKLSSHNIHLQNQIDGPKTPQMAQFMVITSITFCFYL